MKANLITGPVKTYFETGAVESTGQYRSSRRHGAFVYYDPSGQIKEQGEYQADKKHNAWKEFDEQGNMVRTRIFRAGNLVETRDEKK